MGPRLLGPWRRLGPIGFNNIKYSLLLESQNRRVTGKNYMGLGPGLGKSGTGRTWSLNLIGKRASAQLWQVSGY